MIPATAADIHSPAVRRAGRDLLSLALMDARNRTLRWAAVFEAASARLQASAEFDPPLWSIGHVGWFQESWIARNMQRQRGVRCDPQVIRLAAADPAADRLYEPNASTREGRWTAALNGGLPSPQALRQGLAETMETTLDLLESAGDGDAALYFYRLALFHEDRCAETLAEAAQAFGVALDAGTSRALFGDLFADAAGTAAAMAPRPPLLFPASRWPLGAPPATPAGGFVWDNEKWAHEVAVPEFEIDAQPVNWSQFTEFAEDGGYDDARCWSAAGWQWLQHDGRRVPRHVEQMRAGVLQRRFGALRRVPLAQPVAHVNLYEAQAWCRWAGRRLPAEVEWDLAAHSGAPRGFRWGAVREWTATPFRAYPGFAPDPWAAFSQPHFGSHQAVRGASLATPGRLRDASLRGFLLPAADHAFTGFRSCAV